MTYSGRLILWGVIAALAATVITGIDWGLPGKRIDRFLFASHSAWSGAELAAYDAERRNTDLGADVDRDPHPATQPVVVNPADPERAEIVRRFRLYSAQPDEMITFMALQQMRPQEKDFDPRLYQYGGLWVYPVGAMLKGAAMIGAIDLRNDKAFYYDKPQEFGRFYVVARLYTLAWYVLLLALVAKALHKLTGSDIAAIAGACAVGVAPVVFATAHEAKPHLAGAALMLLGCLAAMRWIDKGRNRDAILVGVVCGLATGMVLSAAVIGIVLPVMALLRKAAPLQRIGALTLAIVWMALAYAITNPYVPINLLRDSAALTSNLKNTQAMYGQGSLVQGLKDGTARLLEAGSPVLIGLGALALLAAVARRRKLSPLAWLLSVPSALVLIQFALLAAGKPAEYGRFAIFPVVALCVGSIWLLGLIPSRWPRWGLQVATPCVVMAIWTWPYLTAFIDDATQDGTRLRAAERLRVLQRDHRELQVFADPAPYALPPLDVWRWEITLTPRNHEPTGEVVIRPIDDASRLKLAPQGYTREVIANPGRAAPITWADKPFEILIRN